MGWRSLSWRLKPDKWGSASQQCSRDCPSLDKTGKDSPQAKNWGKDIWLNRTLFASSQRLAEIQLFLLAACTLICDWALERNGVAALHLSLFSYPTFSFHCFLWDWINIKVANVSPGCVFWSISYQGVGTSVRLPGRSSLKLPQTSLMCTGNTAVRKDLQVWLGNVAKSHHPHTTRYYQLHDLYGTWRMEDLERSLLTGLRPGKRCGESFALFSKFIMSQCCQLVDITLQLFRECSLERFTFSNGKKMSQQFNTRGVPPAASEVSRCRGLEVGWSASSQASATLWKPLEQRHPAPAHQTITPSCLLLPANGNGLHFLLQ